MTHLNSEVWMVPFVWFGGFPGAVLPGLWTRDWAMFFCLHWWPWIASPWSAWWCSEELALPSGPLSLCRSPSAPGPETPWKITHMTWQWPCGRYLKNTKGLINLSLNEKGKRSPLRDTAANYNDCWNTSLGEFENMVFFTSLFLIIYKATTISIQRQEGPNNTRSLCSCPLIVVPTEANTYTHFY